MWQLKRYRGKWCAVSTIEGQTVRRSSGTEDYEDAVRWFDDFTRIQSAPDKTVREIYEAYRREKNEGEQRKMKFMWKNLEQHFGDYRIDQLDRSKAKSYAEFRAAQGASNNTTLRELGSIRAAARWFDKQYPATWFMPSKPPPKDRYLTREEYDLLLDSASSPHIGLFIILALTTGARTSAILELTWPQIDFKRRMVNFGEGAHNKRRAQVPLNDKAMEALEQAYRIRICDFVIEYSGRQLKSIRKGFDRARDTAGLGKDVTPHVLRHSAAVWMAEAGISMDEIAQYLGHSSPQITYSTYARYSPNYLRKASDVLQ